MNVPKDNPWLVWGSRMREEVHPHVTKLVFTANNKKATERHDAIERVLSAAGNVMVMRVRIPIDELILKGNSVKDKKDALIKELEGIKWWHFKGKHKKQLMLNLMEAQGTLLAYQDAIQVIINTKPPGKEVSIERELKKNGSI